MTFTLHHGDCREVMATFDADSIDAVVCDPPYGLSFMGKGWDHGVPGVEFWTEALRVAKPGAYLMAFGGTRTFHRLAVAIEDAGWEKRDCVCWLYGSGFPKSHNLDGDRKGWGTALKPAWEPIIVARKPLARGLTVAANVQRFGTGAINVDGCRVDGEKTPAPVGQYGGSTVGPNGHSGIRDGSSDHLGRWPANVCHDGSPEVLAGFPNCDGQIGGNNDPNGAMGYHGGARGLSTPGIADSGSAARFFYTAKASREDREAGLREAEVQTGCGGDMPTDDDGADRDRFKKVARNIHPTVKPTDLMRWLVRMVGHPGCTILDPFMGSGSTGKAARLEGFRFVGIDREAEYVAIARARIESVDRQTDLFF